MTGARPRLILAALLVVAGAACSSDDEPGGAANTSATASTSTSTITEPIPEDAIWKPDDDALTFVRFVERETPTSGDGPTGVAYRRADVVVARILHAPGARGGETAVFDEDDDGAGAVVPLTGGGGAMVTISGARSRDEATEAVTEIAELLGDGTQLGFGTGADPVERLGAYELIGRFDRSVPVVESTTTLLEYSRPEGAVRIEQAELIDPDTPLEVAAGPFGAAIETDDGLRMAVAEGATGFAPTLTAILGTSRVTITAAEDDLRRLAHSLRPVDRATIEDMVREVTTSVVEGEEGEPVVDGVTFYLRADPSQACIDGEEPEGCAEAGRYGPLTMASIPRGDTYLVVGCIQQQIPITGVVLDGRPIATRTVPCGRPFSAADVPPGTLTISFDDGPGGVGTYTFPLA